MKPILQPSLVNDPLGDPGLFVPFLYEKRAFLFDMGDQSPLTNGDLLKVSHIFVSHTHIDHFIGFDRFLRVVFGRDKTITLYGPENFIANVEGKLAGFTWNLVDRYDESLTLEVVEVHPGRLRKATFRAIEKFKRSDEREEAWDGGLILDEPALSVSAAVLEHRVPCLGLCPQRKISRKHQQRWIDGDASRAGRMVESGEAKYLRGSTRRPVDSGSGGSQRVAGNTGVHAGDVEGETGDHHAGAENCLYHGHGVLADQYSACLSI